MCVQPPVAAAILMSRCVVTSFVFFYFVLSLSLSALGNCLGSSLLPHLLRFLLLCCCCCCSLCLCAEIAFLCILHFNKFSPLLLLPFMLVFWHDFIYIKNFSSRLVSFRLFFLSFLPFGLWEIYFLVAVLVVALRCRC